MAEGDGSHDPWKDHEARIRVLEAARKELEDSFIVMTHLEIKQNNILKALVERQEAQRGEQEAEHRRHIEQGERIDKLVSAIGELIRRIPPENLR